MKVGDRIRVFEVQEGFFYSEIISKHTAEKIDQYLGNKYGVNLCYGFEGSKGEYISYHANIDNENLKHRDIKHVCTMV